jgi:hypothetical protein
MSKCLHLDEAPLQTFTQNPPLTQNLATITEGLEHEVFDDISEIQFHHPANNTSTTVAGSSQNARGTSSNQINRGVPHQSPPQATSLIQLIQGDPEPKQLHIEDWEDEVSKDEAAKEAKLVRVQ